MNLAYSVVKNTYHIEKIENYEKSVSRFRLTQNNRNVVYILLHPLSCRIERKLKARNFSIAFHYRDHRIFCWDKI